MRDLWTYADLTGSRRLRRYIVAAALIVVLMGLLFGWAGWPWLQASWVESSTADPANRGEVAWIPARARRATALPIQAAGGCPSDPEAWRLLDVYPGDHYKRIEPACVYQDLSKTIAWHLLVRSGYTKPEAAAMLGFRGLPWQPTSSIMGLTNLKGPRVIPLEMESAPHPAYRTWAVNADGQSALTYSLRGCYRTRTIVGNQVESWERYAVICVVAYDRDPGWTVNELGKQHFTVDLRAASPLRRFILCGYTGQTWVLLGQAHDPQMDIKEPAAAGQEREQDSARYGAIPWDATWLSATFGLQLHPLPDGWRTFDADPDAIQAIANELDDALQVFGGSSP